VIPYNPARPTNAKINRENPADAPPNKSPTRSYWKNPTKPQFNEPMTMSNIAIKRKAFIEFSLKNTDSTRPQILSPSTMDLRTCPILIVKEF
jgi:hypothetical protein